MHHNIAFFDSYEEQVNYFVSLTKVKILPMTEGRISFLNQLGKWFSEYSNIESGQATASLIPPNPIHNFSFPTALEILSIAIKMHSDAYNVQNVYSLLEEYGLSKDKANQPIVSLSGGEILLLNYAKSNAMLPISTKLTACSPTYWLNSSKYEYWNKLARAFEEQGKHVNVALLRGEIFPGVNNTEMFEHFQEDENEIIWQLNAENPKVVFPEITFPSHTPESSIQYINNIKTKLSSPTLITGDNGVGKSIFAKLLTGVLKPESGEVFAVSRNAKGYARMIFQDSIDQLFGMSIDNHMDWVFRGDANKSKLARTIYTEIESSLQASLHQNYFESLVALGESDKRTTLLQAKISLLSERIASLPPLIILDELGWGLSKPVSRLLLKEICLQAHKNGAAVAFISHQPDWWQGLIKSHMTLKKTDDNSVLIETNEVIS